MGDLETDYLVIGAGASGLAFADALVAASDADVLLVDRRERVGGHWNDAYAFVRLHQPAASYGVNSRAFPGEARAGADGMYPLAAGAEVRDYFWRVLDEHLEPTGQVRFLGGCTHAGGDAAAQRLETRDGPRTVRVRRKVVDTSYLATEVPATPTRSFEVEAGAHVVPVGALHEAATGFERHVVIGSGKTAMDACVYLLDGGVAPDRIRWIRPRDQWLLDRASLQPLEQVGTVVEGFSLDVEALATADSPDHLFANLEASGRLLRLDPDVTPTMYRCAIVTRAELAGLRAIEDVVRLGHVRRVGPRSITLDGGTLPTDPGTLHVDCAAYGLRSAPPGPVFAPGVITLQQVRPCSPVFNAALAGYVEATREDLAEQNRLCPVSRVPRAPGQWLTNLAAALRVGRLWREPDLAAWLESSRVNLLRGIAAQAHDPRIQRAAERNRRHVPAALAKLAAFAR